MAETQFQVLRGAGFALAVALALVLQRLSPYGRLRGNWRVNAGLWTIDAVVLGVVCGACACTAARWAADAGVGVLNDGTIPLWIAVALTVLGLDLVSYVWHRANHRIRFLWRFHQVHHSDDAFTVSTGFRFHPGELLLSLPLRLAAVVALGAPVLGVAAFEILFAVANLVEHGDIRLPGGLERRLALVCVTPALHRRHHSLRRSELNSNFGTIFTFWDRVLRTFGAGSSRVLVHTGLPGLQGRLPLGRALMLPTKLLEQGR